MRKILGLSLILVAAVSVPVFSQVGSACTQTLRLARSTYDAGRLHEIPGILKNCLSQSKNGDAGAFSKSELTEAYKLLALSYIYLEEPEKADTVMMALLNADHFFKINRDVDPAELIALYKKYRTWQLFRVGVKVGANGTFAKPTEDYYVTNAGPGTYSPKIGIQLGAVFERDFFKKFTLGTEILYTGRSVGYTNSTLFPSDPGGGSIASTTSSSSSASFKSTYTESWIDFNPIIQYRLKGNNRDPEQTFIPYVGVGPGLGYLLNFNGTLQSQGANSSFVVNGPDVKLKSSCYSFTYSAIAVAGVKYLIGGIYLTADVRFQYGLKNIVNPAHRTNAEATEDYGAPLAQHVNNNVMVNLGFLYPFFKPKKLIK